MGRWFTVTARVALKENGKKSRMVFLVNTESFFSAEVRVTELISKCEMHDLLEVISIRRESYDLVADNPEKESRYKVVWRYADDEKSKEVSIVSADSTRDAEDSEKARWEQEGDRIKILSVQQVKIDVVDWGEYGNKSQE
jgi:hypothetical protein